MADDGEPLEILELDQSLDEAEKPPELPNGIYEGEVQNVQRATSGAGNDYYNITVHINQESIPSNMADSFEDGAMLSYNRQLVPKPGTGTYRRSLYNLRKLLEAMDVDIAGMTTFDPNSIMGLPCRVRIKQSPYQGEMRAGIQEFVSVGASAPARPRGKAAAAAEPEDESEGEEAPAPTRRAPAKGRR